MSDLIGCELPGLSLNVLRLRAATPDEIATGRHCGECLRSSHFVSKWAKRRNGAAVCALVCKLLDRKTATREICDAFDPPATMGGPRGWPIFWCVK